ncbi:MAG: hypothetical protein IH604_15795, partial [Burkholderiales bacterium]|nr:hypothetical protein [Burkholderiales bacterium]
MQLILGAAGAAFGTMVGIGPQMGWAIGSMIGGAMAGPTKVDGQHQQQLADLRVTGGEYGQCIPFVLGTAGIAGQIWWNTDRRATTTETTQRSGKGGGGTESTSSTINYDMDILIGLSDNPINGITRIWDNGALIWTHSLGSTPESRAASDATTKWRRMTVYTGADDQLPDPTYEAAVGVGNAPAYRGRGSVFIEGLNLGGGGALPNLVFEVDAGDGSGGGVYVLDVTISTSTETPFEFRSVALDSGWNGVQPLAMTVTIDAAATQGSSTSAPALSTGGSPVGPTPFPDGTILTLFNNGAIQGHNGRDGVGGAGGNASGGEVGGDPYPWTMGSPGTDGEDATPGENGGVGISIEWPLYTPNGLGSVTGGTPGAGAGGGGGGAGP